MTFSRTFITLTYVVAALGFISLLLSGEIGAPGIAAMVLGLVGSRGRFRALGPSDATWRALTVVFLAYAVLQYFLLGQTALTVARDLLLYLQINRLFVRRVNRDYGYIFLLAFLQVLLGCILTINPLFALILVACMLAGGWALLLLQIKIGIDTQAEIEAGAPETSSAPDPLLDGGRYRSAGELLKAPLLLASGAVSLVMLAMTIGLFLLTPRMEISLFHRRGSEAVHVAGFSEEVGLGEVGRILTRRDRVMRVKVDVKPGTNLGVPYWRGMALDEFDGQTWRLSQVRQELVHTRPLALNAGHLPRGTNVVERFTLEPLDSRVMFVLPGVLEVESSVSNILRNFTGSYETFERQGRMDYVVYSAYTDPSARELRGTTVTLPPRVAHLYLQMPNLSGEVEALAKRITAGMTDPYDKVRAVESYLRKGYTYTLEPTSQGAAPLEDFLFRTRAGHCEYFASAMVILLREVGVPSRMVNGFYGGDLNPVGGYYVVRQKDAHSWVEVWFSKFGWVRFDPTPPGSAGGAGDEPSFFSRMSDYVDFFEMQWYRYVLDYDLRAQLDLFANLITGSGGGGPSSIFDEPGERVDRGAMLRYSAILLTVIGLLAGGIWWYQRRRVTVHAPAVLGTPSARRFLKQREALHRELERRGFARRPGETPLERAGRAGQGLGVGEAFQKVESVFYAARYGQVPVEEQEVARTRAVLERTRRLPVVKQGVKGAGKGAGNGGGEGARG